ncbi:glycoside/pentoside/hexuronide:cation symporter, GPH family [Evansella caseinilytica]|uniref:Glycoside/pentoside/hexuronide:cation symporter, GPH family n=1 Tax=Evansella caseinilytica TaxID=1503961 RepID=A0A1H3UTZ3_9BACI|nr:MFS transporter [Evansella caseinilytica]SDZ65920.1 glycoside/pentoside/hexuronide:cation symporter, GPH family [Evansella caseinilytica]
MYKVDQVSWKERISYSLADTASNLIFVMVSTYLLYFYTDVYGIGAGVVGTLFLIVRFLDAGTDLLAGYVIDRTNTKWGKCRPYFFWLAVPFAAVGVLAFTSPDLSVQGKILFAYSSYILLGLIYTFINIPLSAMLPSMSNNPQERHEVTSIRMIFGQAGGLVVSVATLPLVAFFGSGNDERGFALTMTFFGVLAIPMFINAFKNTKEREYYQSTKSVPLREGMKAFNFPWFIIFVTKLAFFFVYIIRNQTTVYFLKYNFGREDLVPAVMALNYLTIISLIVLPLVTKRLGGKKTMQFGIVLSIIGSLIIFLSTMTFSIPLLLIGVGLGGLGLGFVPSLLFSLVADTIDYGEWKSGVRATGLLYSGSTFAAKFGMGIGGAAGAWLLALYNYDPALTQQSATALKAIEFCFVWFPIISFVLVFILLQFYKLDKIHSQVVADLKQRNSAKTNVKEA